MTSQTSLTPSSVPWWTLRFEALVETDPLLMGTEDGPAEAEVDFAIQLAGLSPGDQVLDVACGTGLHSCFLQKRGVVATGVDLSRRLLRVAQDAWEGETGGPSWMPGDMRWLPRSGPYDAAVLFGPSFGFFEDDDEHRRTLTSIADLLKSNGKLVCNLYNPYHWAGRPFTQYSPSAEDGPTADAVRSYRFDAMRGRVEERTVLFCDGVRRELPVATTRAWTPAEVITLFRSAGFRRVVVYGSDGWAVPEEPLPVHPQESVFLWVLAEL